MKEIDRVELNEQFKNFMKNNKDERKFWTGYPQIVGSLRSEVEKRVIDSRRANRRIYKKAIRGMVYRLFSFAMAPLLFLSGAYSYAHSHKEFSTEMMLYKKVIEEFDTDGKFTSSEAEGVYVDFGDLSIKEKILKNLDTIEQYSFTNDTDLTRNKIYVRKQDRIRNLSSMYETDDVNFSNNEVGSKTLEGEEKEYYETILNNELAEFDANNPDYAKLTMEKYVPTKEDTVSFSGDDIISYYIPYSVFVLYLLGLCLYKDKLCYVNKLGKNGTKLTIQRKSEKIPLKDALSYYRACFISSELDRMLDSSQVEETIKFDKELFINGAIINEFEKRMVMKYTNTSDKDKGKKNK